MRQPRQAERGAPGAGSASASASLPVRALTDAPARWRAARRQPAPSASTSSTASHAARTQRAACQPAARWHDGDGGTPCLPASPA